MQGTNIERLKERLLQEFDKFFSGVSEFAQSEVGVHEIEERVLSGLMGMGQLALKTSWI